MSAEREMLERLDRMALRTRATAVATGQNAAAIVRTMLPAVKAEWLAIPASSRFLDLDDPQVRLRLADALAVQPLWWEVRRPDGAYVMTKMMTPQSAADYILEALRHEPGVVDSAHDDRPAPAHAVEAPTP